MLRPDVPARPKFAANISDNTDCNTAPNARTPIETVARNCVVFAGDVRSCQLHGV